jgi:DNA-directed RNA polymerase subunit M/transcription elongation factor TFIIS
MDLQTEQKLFRELCLSKKATTNLDKNGLEQEKNKLNNLYDVPYNLISKAESSIDRKEAVQRINSLLNNMMFSIELEKGLFEYSLTYIVTKKLQHHYCDRIYQMELYNICSNLDQNNENINNQTLRPAVLNGEISPHLIPFLLPWQVHRKRWLPVLQKQKREDQAMTSIATYEDPENKCRNCGSIKFSSYEQQIRSADEPATKFIICVDCSYTITIN